MAFIWYDLVLLVVFVAFVSFFLYSRRKNLQKEGLLLLYKTPWGIRLINKIGKKYKKTMKVFGWASIISGYILMIGMIYMIYTIVNVYLFNQEVVRLIKVPPIMPLIPYIDKIVPGLPDFYFFYWILIVILIAVPHEFAHGIMAAYNKVKIKTTGFGFFPSFLPVFLAAFVELDEKAMARKKKFQQMATLSAGTFANVLTAIVLLGSLWVVFPLMFSASGVAFDGYQMALLNSSNVQTIDGKPVPTLDYPYVLNHTKEIGLTSLTTNNNTYVLTEELVLATGYSDALDEGYIVVYENSPAINYGLEGAITEVNGNKITSLKELQKEFGSFSPGDTVNITTLINDSKREYQITLGEDPENKTQAWLGIGIVSSQQRPVAKFISKFTGFKDEHINYVPLFGDFSLFIYNFLWWATIICFSVALVNMLPVGLFDGGRFFYLTIFAITKSEKAAKRTFAALTYIFLFLIALLMVLWAASFF